MPINATTMNLINSSEISGKGSAISSHDIEAFQQALQALAIQDGQGIAGNSAVSAAAAESANIGETDTKRKDSLIDRMSDSISSGLMEGGERMQSFYKHWGHALANQKLAHGPAMLSIQLELMNATVLIDVITKVANKAATTIDSMIRMQ